MDGGVVSTHRGILLFCDHTPFLLFELPQLFTEGPLTSNPSSHVIVQLVPN
jgi:hypothetical protein